jgi:chemotaxis protein MotA
LFAIKLGVANASKKELMANKSTLSGIIIAVAGITAGLYFDGGKIGQLLQPTAALIVLGGTLGAVLVQFPLSVVIQAAGQLKGVFIGAQDPAAQLIAALVGYAARARRNGLVSLDAELEKIENPFLRKAMTMAVDGIHSTELRQVMELEMDKESEHDDMIPKVFDAAGGFAPTIGILGAVIGLIQVMQRLQSINEVGKGIAVAFVATIYGVGSANLFFLPFAGRIKILMRRKQVLRELMLDGVISIVERTNPRALESKLGVYLGRGTETQKLRLVAK